MAVSFKSMWNLLNVMQIVAYLKYVENSPANLQTILQTIHNAVTLEPVINAMKDYGTKKYEVAKEKYELEDLAKFDLEKGSLFWNLGVIAIAFFLLALLFGLYYLLRCCRRNC